MAGIDQKTLWEFAKIVSGGKGVEPTKRVQATFLRIDRDGTGWVRLAGSSEETPVNGSSFASAKAGDTVELTIGDGVLSVRGNSSDPAVGQSKVTEIVRPMVSEVRIRLEKSVSVAEAIADAAKKVADAVNQHFFSDTNGIHVTSTTQDEWDAQHAGPNVLINSLGQLFRDGLNNLLTLTTENGARALTIWDGLGNSASNILARFSSTATTYYVNGNKRTEVSADGLEVFDGTYGSEESVAAFGTVARLGKSTGNKVIADSTGVHIYDVQGSQVAAFGQAPGELTTTMLSDEPEIGTNYPVPSDAISDISIMLDDQTLVEDTDYTLSSGIVTLLESATVTSILDDSGSSGEEGSEDVDAHSLTCEYRASAGVGLAIGTSVTRPGLDVAERAVFRHPSFVEASHGTSNADTGFRASRTDTGIQVFCGIGIGGVNHGVYSHVLNRWLINADRSAVHVAPHTVTDGNINVKSKYVYATTPSASKGNGWGHGLQYLDTAGALVGVVKAYSLTTGEKGIQLSATRKVGSTTVNNGVMLGVDSSGNRKLTFNGGGRALWRQALGFDSGYVSSSYGGSDNAPNNAYRDIPITFNFTHTYAPHVVVSFATGSTGVTMGGLSLSAFDVTTTGCKVRIYNNTSDTRNPPLYWVAVD